MKTVPTHMIRFLTKKHIQRYTRRLESGHPVVNVEETTRYLKIWQSIEAKDCDWEKMTEEERNEAIDAAVDEY